MCSIKQSSRIAPLLQLVQDLHQPSLLHQLQKPSYKDWEDWESSSSLLSPFAAPRRSCQQRHQVTAAWKGDESWGRAGISVLCPPGARTSPPSISLSCLCCSGTCNQSLSRAWTLRMGTGGTPHPQNYQHCNFFPLHCKHSFLDNLLLFMATEEGMTLEMCLSHSRLYPQPNSVQDLLILWMVLVIYKALL